MHNRSQAPVPDHRITGSRPGSSPEWSCRQQAAGPAQLSTEPVRRLSSVVCRQSSVVSASRLSTASVVCSQSSVRLSSAVSRLSRLSSVVCPSVVCSMSVCSSVCMSVRPSVRLPLSVCSACPSVRLSVCRLSSVHPAVNVSRMSPVNVCLSMSDVSDGPGMPETERNSRQAVFVQSRAKVSGTTRYFRAAST